jgi:hypothetical protein
MILRRILNTREVQRAIDAGGPLQDLQVDPEKLAEMAIAVVEVDDAIVAYWVLWYALHVEPLWIAPAYRKHPGVVGAIVEQMRETAEATGEAAAFCVIEESELAALVQSYATRLGFSEAPGSLYYVVLQPAAEPVEG